MAMYWYQIVNGEMPQPEETKVRTETSREEGGIQYVSMYVGKGSSRKAQQFSVRTWMGLSNSN